ncbi:MAG: hypothetical protein IJC04_03580 [Oscillospiraceae bacterium]|nr:hypothetical protein [Oscillospiraceae bacterium]
MYKSFDINEFKQALNEKNYSYIKTCIISAIRNNPRFNFEAGTQKCEADRAFEEAINACPEMLEEYHLLEDEVAFEQSSSDEWDYEYFIRQTFRFGRNFCKKRYDNIKKVGKTISLNFPQPQEQQKEAHQIQTPDNNMQRKNRFPKLAILLGAIIAVLVLVAILIVKVF